jgi:hypothetical protein
MKFTTFLFLFLLVSGCGKKQAEEASDNFFFPLSSIVLPEDGSLPVEASTFDVNMRFIKFSGEEREKMEEAIEIVKLVVATEEFKERVLNHTYNGEKTFVDNEGLTNEEIYRVILAGAETLRSSANNTMDVEVELYHSSNNVIGYTYPDSRRIWVNRKYFSIYTPAGVAHNLFHEWMHKLGFSHSSSWTPDRDYSVPYAIGYIIGEIGRDFL